MQSFKLKRKEDYANPGHISTKLSHHIYYSGLLEEIRASLI